MRIGILAKQAGISTSRIRFYEAHGLLPPALRMASGYRDYDGRALDIIRFIARARDLGFSLAEIANHLASPRDGRKARLLVRVETKLDELTAQAAALARQRDAVSRLLIELRDGASDGVTSS